MAMRRAVQPFRQLPAILICKQRFTSLILDKAYINGQWTTSKTGKSFPVYNPANGDVLGHVPDMGLSETQGAIKCAHHAFYIWRDYTAKDRSSILSKWAKLITSNNEDLARLLTSEMGKPLKDALGEVNYAAEFIEWFAGEARRVYGDVIMSADPKKRILTIKQPVGVAALITPWNFPMAMVTRKAAPALAAGCSVVLKPAEDTPFCALALAKLGEEAGLPAGVFNCVTASRDNARVVGEVLCESPLVTALSFTGSTHIGKILIKQCADTVKKMSLELGGNAPFIVFESAVLDNAVKAAVASKFRSSGQTCVCSNRFLVQESIYEEFVQRFAEETRKLKLGNGLIEGTTQGPLINERAVNKIHNMVVDATTKGATVVTGGEKGPPEGSYYLPTILSDVTTNMKCMQEESFGPLAPVMKFKTESEALTIANNTNYGLASYIYSQDIRQVWRVAEKLEVGMVGINEGLITFQVSEAPLGGVKESGLGREGSKYGMEEYLEVKYICLGDMQ